MGFLLRSANSIFLDSSLAVRGSYLSMVDCYYKAGVTTLPLQDDPQISADKINDLISPGSLGRDTMAVLVNTVYFKAPWRLPFNKFSTQQDVMSPGRTTARSWWT